MAALTFDDLIDHPSAKNSGALTFDDLIKPNIEQPMSPMGARVQGFNQTVPFGNRITAGVASLALAPFTDLTTSELYETARAKQKATSEQYPDQEITGNLLGAAATLPIGFVKTAATTPVLGQASNALSKASTGTANFIGRGSTLAGRAIRSAGVAAPFGAVYGYGAGDEGSRLEDAASTAGVSGLIAGAVPIAGAAIGGTVAAAADKIARNRAIKSGEIASVVPSNEMQKIYNRLVGDYGAEDAQKILNSYSSKQGQSLVEAGGKRTAGLAEGAAQYPTSSAMASEFFDDAVGRAPEKLKGSLQKTVSPSANYYDDADKIVEEGRKKVAPLYSEAYKANQAVESPVISRILETPEGRSALGDAAKNMQNEMALLSRPDPELTLLAREAGMQSTGQGVGSGLKLRTLDYVKRSMDDTIRLARRAGDDGQVRRITALKNGLVSEMDASDTTGLYAKARKESGDYLSASDALEQGTRFLRDDAQLIKRNYDIMGAAEKKAYKVGVIKTMREQIDNAVDGANVARMFNKPATRQKLESILSPKEYGRLMNDAYATDKIYKLRNQISGNSRTAQRQIAAEEFQNSGLDIAMDIASGNPLRTGFNVVKGIASKVVDGLSDKSAAEVSRILYTTDPQEKYKIVKELSNLSKINNPRGTQAGKKLQAFYTISDALKMKTQQPQIQQVP